jgi:glycine hydroxymethyltransferase
LIDYNEVEEMAKKYKPKMIIAGFSAYSRNLDFAKFRDIADSVGAYLMADVAHIAGIIASGFHQNPLEYAHVVTSTTHKTLRGPRGGVIMTNHEDIAKKIDSAVFPGLQGGPLMHVIAAKAVAFGEALKPEFKSYISQVLTNAKVLSSELINNDIDVLTGGTENHMALVDLRKYNLTGKDVGLALEKVGIICNKNSIPFDTTSPFITSGVRLGTPAATTSGCGEHEFRIIGDVIVNVIKNFKDLNDSLTKKLSLDIQDITKQLKVY